MYIGSSSQANIVTTHECKNNPESFEVTCFNINHNSLQSDHVNFQICDYYTHLLACHTG